MTGEPASTARGTPVSARLEPWRAAILARVAPVAAVAGVAALVFTGPDLYRRGDYEVLGFGALMVAMWLLVALLRGHVLLRARLLLWPGAALVVAGVHDVGLTSGAGAIAACVAIMGTVLLGAREAALLSLTILWGVILWWIGMDLGWWPRPSPVDSDAGSLALMPRIVVTTAAVTVVAVVAVSYVLRQLTDALVRAEKLVGDLRHQIEAREHEARRRTEAEHRLWEAQRTEMIARIASGVAHDVNNNLTVILVNANLIGREPGISDDVREGLSAIAEACENAAALTRQLLAVGRRDVSQPEIVAVRGVLDKVARIARPAVGRQVALRIEIPGQVPPVCVDPALLQQALLNLLLNARDAMPSGGDLVVTVDAGGAPLELALASAPAAPEHPVRIHVRDTGSGIAPDVLPHVFEPFFTTKDVGRGTGLGLAMVCAFAESSGGRVGVATTAGAGSTFTIELPAARAAVADAAAPPARAAGASVLVVDDDERVRAIIAAVLGDAGYRVAAAADGDAALAHARAAGPLDAICLDVVMPGLSGEELVRRIREVRPATPVLVCSAYVHDAGLRDWIEAGAFPVLRKPFSPAELRHAIDSAIAGRAAAPPAAGALRTTP
jgi:signal transduction histidine kinase/ActR/RegA family two-component response regulator